MINTILFILVSIVVIGWIVRKVEQFDLWFKDKVHNFLNK
jgi:hypothetical protein